MKDDWPNFKSYSYETLLDVFQKIDGRKYPNRKAYVAELIEAAHGKDRQEDVSSSSYQGHSSTLIPKYDTFVERFFAGWIDGILLSLIAYGIEAVAMLLPVWLGAALVSITILNAYFYSVTLHTAYGQTVGKMFMGVRVVNNEGEGVITFKNAFLRDAIPILLTFLMLVIWPNWNVIAENQSTAPMPFFFSFILVLSLVWTGLEILTMLSNEKRRALHDYIAGTVVVKV